MMQGKITPFVHNTFTILNEENTDDIISWGSTGEYFIIKDQYAFSSDILPRYFKHNNISSFIRQLNTYQFHKIPNEELNLPESSNYIAFSHPYFKKGREELLCNVIRRTKPQRRSLSPGNKARSRINNPVACSPVNPTFPISLTENNNIPTTDMSPETMAKQVVHMFNRLEQTNQLLLSVHNELVETKDTLHRLQQQGGPTRRNSYTDRAVQMLAPIHDHPSSNRQILDGFDPSQ